MIRPTKFTKWLLPILIIMVWMFFLGRASYSPPKDKPEPTPIQDVLKNFEADVTFTYEYDLFTIQGRLRNDSSYEVKVTTDYKFLRGVCYEGLKRFRLHWGHRVPYTYHEIDGMSIRVDIDYAQTLRQHIHCMEKMIMEEIEDTFR